jgi:hypothetical protein
LDIDRVIIEEPLLNARNVYTVATLLKFNGMISKIAEEVLGVVPDFISSYDARCYGFPELMRKRTHNKKGPELMRKRTHNKKGEPYPDKQVANSKPVLFGEYPWDVDKKHVIWEKVSELEPQIVWEYTRNQTLKKECYDMADAYACVLGFMKKEGIWANETIQS